MFLNLLVSLCSIVFTSDTLDVATVSSQRNAAAGSFAPVHSISASGIERLGAVGLHEAVGMLSGVSIRDYGGTGGLKTVSVRNMGAAHTAIVYDGIAVSDAQNGQTDISRFNLEDIGSVSMNIGLSDDIFCSARHLTSAGILRLESMMPAFEDGSSEVDARITCGSFGTYIPYVGLKQKLGSCYALKSSLRGTFSKGDYPFKLKNGRVMSSERRLNSDVESYGAEACFYADWDHHGKLKAKADYYCSERGLPGSVILYTQNAYERLWDKSLISNIMYDYNLDSHWKFHADAGFSHSFNRHTDSNPVYPYVQDSRYSQNEYSLAARALFAPAVGWKLSLAEDVFANTLWSNIPECPFPIRLTSATALSGQYECRSIRVSAGLVGMAVREWTEGEGGRRIISADRFRLSPFAGISWNVLAGMHLRASYKDGFRLPTFNDLYYSRVGNVDLRPETARQFNIGVTYSGTYDWGTLDVSSDGYCNLVKDKIVAVPTMFIWKMRNVGEVSMYGSDLNSSVLWKVCSWLSTHVNCNYSLQYALDVTDCSSKSYRHQIPYTPRHCGSGSLSLESPWVTVSYRVSASGHRYSLGQNIPANRIDGYADHCVSINRTFSLGRGYDMHISAEGLNLSGRNYEIIHYYPMPGRSFRLTVKFSAKCGRKHKEP